MLQKFESRKSEQRKRENSERTQEWWKNEERIDPFTYFFLIQEPFLRNPFVNLIGKKGRKEGINFVLRQEQGRRNFLWRR